MLLIALSRLEGRVPGREYKLGGLDTVVSQMSNKVTALKDRAILEQTAEGVKSVLRFRSSLFEWFMIQQIEDAKNAMHLVWKNKDAVHSTVKWVGGVIGSLGKGIVAPGT